jgi:quercetin dioxygenase-like cupin family protein
VTKVVRLSEQGPHELAGGVLMFPLFGEAAMLNVVEFEPNAVVPLHRHEHEQLGLVLDGEITMTIDGADHVCAPDVAYQIPGGVEHGGRAGSEGCRVLDVFVPVREDYRALAGE